jgi:hypothetical protein
MYYGNNHSGIKTLYHCTLPQVSGKVPVLLVPGAKSDVVADTASRMLYFPQSVARAGAVSTHTGVATGAPTGLTRGETTLLTPGASA